VAVGKAFKGGKEDWQREAWYYYDAVGEFRSAVTWIGNAVSKADLHAAEYDRESGTVGEPTDDARVQAAAQAVLGGPAQRAQLLKQLAVMWQVPGEGFIVIRPTGGERTDGTPQPDEWLVLSGTRLQFKGGAWSYTDPRTLRPVTLTSNDRLIRVWDPHPDDPIKSDSAARPALPILREVEKSSQNIAARLDSRLAGNGIWLVPSEMDFPRADGLSKAESLMDFVMTAMEASLRNPGQASAQVPIVVEVPGEFIPQAAQGFLDFSTAFDAAVVELRTTGLSRLAATLDMPNETAEGSTGGMNHWGAWQVEETTYKVYIEPLLDRLADAITEHYFHPVLRAMGVADADRWVLAWDTTSIVARPERTSELMELHERVLISDDYLRAELGIPDDAVPGEDERIRRELLRLVAGAPTLLASPQVGDRLFGFELPPATVGVDPAAADAAAGEEVDTGQGSRELPAAPESTRPDAQTPRDDAGEVPDGLVAAAELIVYDALSRAGGRLLTREHRGQFASTPKHELYLHLPGTDAHGPLLRDSFTFVDRVAETFGMRRAVLGDCLYAYCVSLLDAKAPHDRVELRARLADVRQA
jgi:hypothetical protein